MTFDRLARFNQPARPAAASAPPDAQRSGAAFSDAAPSRERVPYEAFQAKDRAHRLRIVCNLNPTRNPRYGSLLDVVHDRDFGESIALIFSFMVVEIRGRNLHPVADAIDAETCGVIREFDRGGHEPVADPRAPLIESIQFHLTDRPGVITADPQAAGSSRH